jgi:energy-coupling factor transporter ATP-binding protein EcfA2
MAATPEQIDRAARESGLDFTDEHGRAQMKAVHALGEGGAYGVLIGRDGAGKSAMLKVMTAVWADKGREVYGASLAREQAEAMTDGGIRKDNIQAFSVLLDVLNDGRLKLGRSDVVAVDEVGQIGTRQMLDLLRHRDAMGLSIVGLGDNRQCSAIEAGEIISLSRRALGADAVPEILTTVRQRSERERKIVTHFRENRPARAIAMKREDGFAHMVMGGPAATVAAVERKAATGCRRTSSSTAWRNGQRYGRAGPSTISGTSQRMTGGHSSPGA